MLEEQNSDRITIEIVLDFLSLYDDACNVPFPQKSTTSPYLEDQTT